MRSMQINYIWETWSKMDIITIFMHVWITFHQEKAVRKHLQLSVEGQWLPEHRHWFWVCLCLSWRRWATLLSLWQILALFGQSGSHTPSGRHSSPPPPEGRATHPRTMVWIRYGRKNESENGIRKVKCLCVSVRTHLDISHYTGGLHSACHIYCVAPNVIVRFTSPNHSSQHSPLIQTWRRETWKRLPP